MASGKFTLTMELEFELTRRDSEPAQTGEGQAGGEAAEYRPTSAERSDNTSGTAGVPVLTGEGQAGGEAAHGGPTSAERRANTSGTAGAPADQTAEHVEDDIPDNVNNVRDEAVDDVEEILLEPVDDGAVNQSEEQTGVEFVEQATEGRPPQQLLDDDVLEVPLPNPGQLTWAGVRRRLVNWNQSCTNRSCGRCFIKDLNKELLARMEVDEEQN